MSSAMKSVQNDIDNKEANLRPRALHLCQQGEKQTFHKRQLCDSKWDESGRDNYQSTVSPIRVFVNDPCYVPSTPILTHPSLANLDLCYVFLENYTLCIQKDFLSSVTKLEKYIKKSKKHL
ncbi:hypothetical protein SK128_001589 [Halocaridina rubra]|uniref:Uncharacterized protein n=1 Tax=Halocaridina rubra TaxID=373956 RepID=A0AAN9AE36_HALRR